MEVNNDFKVFSVTKAKSYFLDCLDSRIRYLTYALVIWYFRQGRILRNYLQNIQAIGLMELNLERIAQA